VKRRILTVVLAIVLAIVGTGLVLVYVNQANSRAIAGQKAVSVVVAQRLIPAGTSAGEAQSEGLFGTETLPAKSVPSNAVQSISPDLSTLVASADIQPGQLVLRPMLVTANLASATGGIVVPSGMEAVTISLCLPEAVANYIHPGSKVAVFDTFNAASGGVGDGSACSGNHTQQAPQAKTGLLLASAEVLSVGPAQAQTNSNGSSTTATSTAFSQGSSSASTSSQGTTLVTLAVSPFNAKRLISLTITGLPYLALLG
jgi:pilus assembly protein CpaB